jgi:hypothetical protein
MSHWRTYKSDVLKNTKEQHLRTALAEIGVELDTSIKSIRNSWGNEQVDMGFKIDGRPIALGLKKVANEDGSECLELKGDFYATGLNESQFMDRLSQVYQRENIIDKLTTNKWTVDNTSVDDKGNIVIEASEYVFA